MEPRIIALYSQAPGMGKSTVASRLVLRHGYVRMSFADPIKALLTELMAYYDIHPDTAYDYLYGAKKEQVVPELGLSGRRMMQSLGVEWGRYHIGFDVWVNALLKQIEVLPPHKKVVIDDLRFANEYTALQKIGAEFWQVHRDGVELSHNHQSDGLLNSIKFDAIIHNNWGREDLDYTVDALLRKPRNATKVGAI